ncbi:MAG: TetR/AcrR family transcriptional regulator [Eubacteriales bacterium]|nr:TetR/AcrR family transcriptional regulator [Eubacteriales bacterium]
MTGIEYPKTQKGQETFAALVEAAGKQFYEKTYHGATIKDITEEAGVGLGTFYIYFESKLVCYEYLLRQYSHKIRSTIGQRVEGLTSQREIEKVGLMVFLEMVRDDQHMYNIIWESLLVEPRFFREYYTNFSDRYQKGIIQGQKKGEFSQGDPEIISYILMGVSNFIGIRYALFSKDEDLEAVSEAVISLLETGLFN